MYRRDFAKNSMDYNSLKGFTSEDRSYGEYFDGFGFYINSTMQP